MIVLRTRSFRNQVALSYTPGSAIAGRNGVIFGRGTAASYFDGNGLLQTASAGSDGLRDAHYINGARTTLIELGATNVCIFCRDLTNAAWVKTNVTPLKDQVGVDGAANSASRITATAANGTCLQAVVLANSARMQSCYIKRLVGVGVINMTTDNGATWVAVAPTAAWTLVYIPPQTLANPTLGFRIVTIGDSIAVDCVQNELDRSQAYPSSPILTAGALATRNGDFFVLPYPYRPQAMWTYLRFIELGGAWVLPQDAVTLYGMMFGAGSRFGIINGGVPGQYEADSDNNVIFGRSQHPGTVPIGGDIELLARWDQLGQVVLSVSINGGAEAVGVSLDPPATFLDPWHAATVGIGGTQAGTNQGFAAFKKILHGFGPQINTIPLARSL